LYIGFLFIAVEIIPCRGTSLLYRGVLYDEGYFGSGLVDKRRILPMKVVSYRRLNARGQI